MRYSFLFLLITNFICCARTDKDTNSEKSQELPVLSHVRVWNFAITFSPGYWNQDKQEEILKQISEKEFEIIKIYASDANKPQQMRVMSDKGVNDSKELVERLSKLKLYKVATFNHYLPDGKFQDKYAILRVPYSGNESWNREAKWDTVYFVIKNSLVE